MGPRYLWRGLRLVGMDGTSILVPNTIENREAFGGHRSHGTESAYPMVRMVVLMTLRSHLLVAANFGAYEGEAVHEIEYAKPLCDSIPESSLTVLDRGYTSAAFLLGIESKADRHWLWGILLVYNMVRLEMESIANQEKIEPTRISFVESLRLIRDEWEWLSVTSPGAIPKRLATLRSA